ncbi:MAG: glucose 1-dehydrogenase [Erythrobacteraceae bacterium]|jgi:NAD(P)-dependent dehydrogenase (short-subunit alcohol dehydrogenase family)|nr:glucose 1-dehydrogenase [Erythrobacteraceae bacterium]
MRGLADKVCIVTGGSQGIGKATCLRLAEEGATVIIADIEDDQAAALCEDIRQTQQRAEFWHLDVTDEDEVAKVFSEVADTFGGIDVLVNNAGIAGPDKPTDEVTAEEWRNVMDVNVMGVFFCTKAAIGHMRKRGGGSIVNISSIYGIVGAPDIPPYHASKGAVREMSKTDAMFFAEDGIRVNSVHPGFIWTPLVEAMAEASDEGRDAFCENLRDLHPIGEIGEPEDIAAGIAYLASDDAKFVTGSELVIDGGYTAR